MARAQSGSLPRAGARAAASSLRPAALVAVVLTAACVHARGTREQPAVVAVDLQGVKSVDGDQLRAKLATRASGRFRWGEVRRLDRDALELDRRRIVAFYRERGYYRASVDEAQIVPEGEGRVRVVLRVDEGKPVRVAHLDVEGLDAAPAARARVPELPLESGDVLTWKAFDATRAQLQSVLGQTGYATGTVSSTALVNGGEGSADVTYRVDPGRRFRFGAVSVEGAVEVPEERVAAQAARLVAPGDWFDERRLDRIQARVFELGVFAGVRVNRGTPDLETGTVPVVVAVREAPFHTVRFGPGIGFESSRWEVVGQAAWYHRNWLGDLRQLKLSARAGYAWIPDPTSPIREGVVGTLAAEFSQPGVFRDVVDLTTGFEVEKSLEQGYGYFSQKFRFGTPYRPSPRWTVVPSANLELYELQDVTDLGPDAPQVQNCPNDLCLLAYLEQRITWDARDHPLLTTEGVYFSFSVQEGFPAGGRGYTYLRFVPDFRWFAPLAGGSVLATRARFGAVVPLNESHPAPIVALFMGGGAAGMRGYGAERLSPMVEEEGVWIPTGGNGILEASVELRKPLSGKLIGALFLDAGNVSEATGSATEFTSALDLSHLQLALGLGLRYRTSVGPLRFDLGCRLPTDFSSGVPFSERFPTVPGASGHREPIVAIHLMIGEAF